MVKTPSFLKKLGVLHMSFRAQRHRARRVEILAKPGSAFRWGRLSLPGRNVKISPPCGRRN